MSVNVPVRIYVKRYTGSKEKLKQEFYAKLQIAKRIEDYINDKMKNLREHVFGYYEIADDLGLTFEIVQDLLFPVDGGSNGITVFNPAIKED